tara:strand:- start:645 stop:1556 length:912 start_codon:yes stop_codon:yes gene_type:complete
MQGNKPKKLKNAALCFSGQVKDLELCYPYIKKNLLDNLGSYDIFCFAEDDSNLKKIKLLKPVKFGQVKSSEVDKIIKGEIKLLQKQNYKTSLCIETFRFNLRNTYQQLYKVSNAFELLEKYMEEKNVNYKHFIRLRFDFLPLDPIRPEDFKLKKNEMIVPGLKMHDPKDIFNDMFFVTNNFNTFKESCSFYNNFRKTVEQELSINPTFFQRLYFTIEKKYRSFFLFLFKKLNKNKRQFPRVLFGVALLLPEKFYKRFKDKNKYVNEKVFFYYLKSKKIEIIKKKFNFVIVRGLTDGLLIFGKE